MDFEARCANGSLDGLSIYFREIKKIRPRVRLNDILEGWKRHEPLASSKLISDVRSAFTFRHWVAHGRYSHPGPSGRYDFKSVLLMADGIISAFKFIG